MTDIGHTLITLSLAGGLLFLLFTILHSCFKHKVSMQWQSTALLLLTVFWLLPVEWLPGQQAQLVVTMPEKTEPISEFVPMIKETAVVLPAAMNQDWLLWLYGIVAVVLLLRFMWQYRMQHQILLRTSWLVPEEKDQQLLQTLLQQHQIRQTVQLRCSPLVQSPVLLGLWKYYILLPNRTLPTESLQFILLHELAHVKRYDNWQKIYLQLLKCIYWFHPCIYGWKRLADDLCEQACDEWVVRDLALPQRKQYGLLLLDMLEQLPKKDSNYCTFRQRVTGMKQRLLHILNCRTSKKVYSISFILAVVVISLIGCGTSAIVEEQLPKVAKPAEIQGTELVTEVTMLLEKRCNPELLAEGEFLIEQKEIQSFSWEAQETGEWIRLYINEEPFYISNGTPETFSYYPASLDQYWQGLWDLQTEEQPQALLDFWNLVWEKRDEISYAVWEEKQKPITTFSWEQRPKPERSVLWINGDAYEYEVFENGSLFLGSGLQYYMKALGEIPLEQMPPDWRERAMQYLPQ